MLPLHYYTEEYERFMFSFRKLYPELYNRYSNNISAGCTERVSISINNNDNISFEAQRLLLIIATDYYDIQL